MMVVVPFTFVMVKNWYYREKRERQVEEGNNKATQIKGGGGLESLHRPSDLAGIPTEYEAFEHVRIKTGPREMPNCRSDLQRRSLA